MCNASGESSCARTNDGQRCLNMDGKEDSDLQHAADDLLPDIVPMCSEERGFEESV